MSPPFTVRAQPATIRVDAIAAGGDALIEQTQRIHKRPHLAPHGNHAQTNLVAHQHHRAWRTAHRIAQRPTA